MTSDEANDSLFILPNDAMGGAEKVLRLVAQQRARESKGGIVWVYVLSGVAPTINPFEAGGPDIRVLYSGTRRAVQGVPGLIRHIRGRRFDVVMSSHTHVNALASLLRRLGALRTRLLVARESTMIFERQFSWPKKLALRAMYRFYGAHDRIVCQTEQMQRSLNRHTGDRFAGQTVTIPNPIRLSEIRQLIGSPGTQSAAHGDPHLVWCGRFHPVKRPELAIAALAALQKTQGPRATLMMMGKGPEFERVAIRVAALGLDQSVILPGHLDNPVAYFASAPHAIGFLTSEMEGFPNVVLEMLAAGIDQVVTTPCCAGLADVPGVTIARGFEPEDLVSAIERAMHTPANRTAIDAHLATRDISAYTSRVFAAG